MHVFFDIFLVVAGVGIGDAVVLFLGLVQGLRH